MREYSGNFTFELLQSINDAVYILDREGNVVQTNDTFCKMLGYNLNELLKLNAKDYNASWEQEKILSTIVKLNNQTETFEIIHKRKDGTTFDAEVSATGIRINGESYLLCISRDITERKNSQILIQQSEKKFRALFENAYDPILLLDIKSFRILDCNPAAEKLFGKNKFQIIHSLLEEFSPEVQYNNEKSEELINFYLNKALKGETTIFEWCFETSDRKIFTDGNLYKVEFNGNSLLQLIIRDITEKKKIGRTT